MVSTERIPAALIERRAWVLWKYEHRNGKATKVPYQPDGRPARVNDSTTWTDYESAREALERGKFDGLGIVLGDGLAGLDLDWKNHDGDGTPVEAETVLGRFASYAELSPSGRGCHILLLGRLPAGARNRARLAEGVELEVYDSGRFFTFTNRRLNGSDVVNQQGELESLLAELDMLPAPAPQCPAPAPTPVNLDDSELLSKMFSSRAGADIRALWSGDWSAYPSQSEADLALASHLVWWTNGDLARADRLFRQSGLYRPEKWDKKHHSDGRTYGAATLEKARSSLNGGYQPQPQAYGRLSLHQPGVEAPSSTLPDDAPWPERQPLPRRLPEAPSLPPEMVPEPLRDWLVQSAERACLPLEMLAVPALIAASGVVGRSVAVRPRDYSDWTVTPNLWGAIVAPPGAKKTDALLEALRPVSLLEEKARRAHEKLELQARAEQALLKAQIQGAVAKAKKSGAVSTGDVAALMERLEALENAPRKRYLSMDATVEKLGEILRDNPRGLTLMRDELASWLAAMEQEENAMARGFFLAAWSGNTGYSFDRIGRGTVHIPAACVALVGGIQPEPLQAVFERLRREPARADGMVQRLQMLVWPDELPDWNPPQSWPDKAAREAAAELFARLDGLERREPQNPSDVAPRLLFLEDEAKRLFAQWHDAHERRLRGSELQGTPHFASHIAKYGSLAASLAVIFHLLEFAHQPHRWVYENDTWRPLIEPPPVTASAVALALDWTEFLELHARKVYSSELQSEAQAVHRLAEAIRAGLVRDGQTIREVQRSSRFWDGERLAEALAVLERLGWLRVVELEPGPAGGRPSEVIRLHPQLRGEA